MINNSWTVHTLRAMDIQKTSFPGNFSHRRMLVTKRTRWSADTRRMQVCGQVQMSWMKPQKSAMATSYEARASGMELSIGTIADWWFDCVAKSALSLASSSKKNQSTMRKTGFEAMQALLQTKCCSRSSVGYLLYYMLKPKELSQLYQLSLPILNREA